MPYMYTNSRDIFEQLWQTHNNQGIISLETQDTAVVHTSLLIL